MSDVSQKIQKILDEGLSEGTYPSASAAVQKIGEKPYLAAAGKDVTPETLYDLASLTKVLSTSTIAARLVERGELDLTENLTDTATIRETLHHQAGFEAWVDFLKIAREKKLNLRPGSKEAKEWVLREIKSHPIAYSHGDETRYSDLGFILLAEFLSRKTGKSLEELFSNEVQKPLNLSHLTWKPKEIVGLEQIAATEDLPYRGGVVRGVVHDDNAYLLGGLAGHSGLFGRARDCLAVGIAWLESLLSDTKFLKQKTAQLFTTTQKSKKDSGRALGWDVPSAKDSQAGKRVSPKAFGHLGYTGTSIWADPERKVVVALLTNRVHPTSKNEKIKSFRPRFHDCVWEAFGR